MSDETHENLALKLGQCAVCSQKHAQPQILPCMHSFCSSCLAGERATEGVSPTQCPVCGIEAAYSVSGVVAHDLISVATASKTKSEVMACGECEHNTAQVWCIKCQVALCSNCHAVTHASRLFQSHALEPAIGRQERSRTLPNCPAHPGEVVSFIARDGITLMCRDCVLVGAGAGGAPADLVEGAIPLRDAALAAKMRLEAVVEFTQRRGAQVRDMQRAVAGVVSQVQEDYERVRGAIITKAGGLEASVDARRVALEQVVSEWKESEVQQSDALMAKLRITKAAISNAARVSTRVANRTDELEALQVMGELHPHLSSLCSLPIPSIHDYPIRPIPSTADPADTSQSEGGVAGKRVIHGDEVIVRRGSGGCFFPGGIAGVHTNGLICALGGSDGGKDLALVETLRVGPRRVLEPDRRQAAADEAVECGQAWSQGVALPVRRRAAACALLGDSLYVVGGWDGKEACASAFVFRRRRGSQDWGWESIAPLRHRRQALACAVLHDKVYAVGGYDGSINLRSVERYDAATDSWLAVADMQQSRRGCAAVAVNGLLLAIGGSEAAAVHASVEAYNMYANEWRIVKPMSTPRRLPSAAVVNGRVVVAGGWDGVRALSSCEAYNPVTDTWGRVPSLAHARQGAAAVTAASRLYVLGGWDGVSNARLSSVEVLGPDDKNWSAAPSLACPRFGLCAAFLPTP